MTPNKGIMHPIGIRPGKKLVVLSDGRNLRLKPFALAPSLKSFRRLIKKLAANKLWQADDKSN